MKKAKKHAKAPKNKKLRRTPKPIGRRYVNLANAPWVDSNMRGFYADAQALVSEFDLNYDLLIDDSFAIYEKNQTLEGAGEAADFYVSVIREKRDSIVAQLKELMDEWKINPLQRQQYRIDQFIQTFESHMTPALGNLREALIKQFHDRTKETVAMVSHTFEAMVREALFE